MAKPYETGSKQQILAYALECAIRDREGMQQSLASHVPDFWKLPREEALAQLSEDDRNYFVEIDGCLRDFERLAKSLQKS